MSIKVNMQNIFSYGEIGDELRGRVELDMYKGGLSYLSDGTPNNQGSLTNRTVGLDYGINEIGEEVFGELTID